MRQITITEMRGLYEDSELLMVQVNAIQIAAPEESGVIGYVVGLRALFAGDPSWRSIGLVCGGERSRAPGPKVYHRLDFVLSAVQTIFLEKTYNLVLWLRASNVEEPVEMFIQEFQLEDKSFGTAEKVRVLILDALRGEKPDIARSRNTADT